MDLDIKLVPFKPEALASIPHRKWDDVIHNVSGVYIIPADEIHDSGYATMEFIAEQFETGNLIRFDGCCDSVRLDGKYFGIDCFPGSKIVRIWNRRYPFSISPDLSSIDFIEEEK